MPGLEGPTISVNLGHHSALERTLSSIYQQISLGKVLSVLFSSTKHMYQPLAREVILSSLRRGTFQTEVMDRGKCLRHK